MQKRRSKIDPSQAGTGNNGLPGRKSVLKMSDGELENACSCPFFRPSFDEWME